MVKGTSSSDSPLFWQDFRLRRRNFNVSTRGFSSSGVSVRSCISVNGSSKMLFDFVAGCSLLDEMTSLTRFGPFSSLLLFRFLRRPYGKGSKFRIGGAGPLDICSL